MIFCKIRGYILYILIGYCISCITSSYIALSEIVIVKSGDATPYKLALEGFKSIIKEEAVEYEMKGDFDKGLKITNKIKREHSKKKPLAIFTIGVMATKLVHSEIDDIPVIFSMVMNPAKYGLANVKNVGGVSIELSIEDQLTNLQKMIPKAKKIGVIYDPANSGNLIKKAKNIANSLKMNLIVKEVNSEKEVPDALKELINNINVLWLIPDATVLNPNSIEFISRTVIENRILVMACSPQLVKRGLPFSFYSDEFLMGRQAGLICQKALDGEIGKVIPIEYPNDVCLAINLITMEKFGIKLSQEILDSAKLIYK